MSNQATVVGNLARDPELRYTPQGKAVVTLSVGDTPRSFDKASGQWTDGVTDWVKVVAWDNLAENVAASLQKGDKVVVIGTYKAEKYEDKTTGEPRTSRKLVADEVSPSLTYAKAKVEKAYRNRDESSAPRANTAPAASGTDSDETPF